jgi:hypothetical protein
MDPGVGRQRESSCGILQALDHMQQSLPPAAPLLAMPLPPAQARGHTEHSARSLHRCAASTRSCHQNCQRLGLLSNPTLQSFGHHVSGPSKARSGHCWLRGGAWTAVLWFMAAASCESGSRSSPEHADQTRQQQRRLQSSRRRSHSDWRNRHVARMQPQVDDHRRWVGWSTQRAAARRTDASILPLAPRQWTRSISATPRQRHSIHSIHSIRELGMHGARRYSGVDAASLRHMGRTVGPLEFRPG